MPEDVFKASPMKLQLLRSLEFAYEAVGMARYRIALNRIEQSVLPKMDGCRLAGSPEKDDWILDCSAQGQVFPVILDIIDLLRNMMRASGQEPPGREPPGREPPGGDTPNRRTSSGVTVSRL
jgi:hypothetical protein